MPPEAIVAAAQDALSELLPALDHAVESQDWGLVLRLETQCHEVLTSLQPLPPGPARDAALRLIGEVAPVLEALSDRISRRHDAAMARLGGDRRMRAAYAQGGAAG